MSERPILFSGEMVRAILEGRKTQTRRVVKRTVEGRVKEPGSNRNWHLDDPYAVLACPYGMVGDRLWVRETFFADGSCVCYQADGWDGPPKVGYDVPNARWKPSIHMPRWASRIDLEITDVCVERVQDISEEDAEAEGAEKGEYLGMEPDGCPALELHPDSDEDATFTGGFAWLWDSINAKRGFGWAENPWVWVVEFRRIEK